MTAYAMKPIFIDRDGYLQWLKSWAAVYENLSQNIAMRKIKVKDYQRHHSEYLNVREIYKAAPEPSDELREKYLDLGRRSVQLSEMQRDLIHFRTVARKMMTLRNEALLRRDRILAMRKQIIEQPFPFEIERCDRVDFHFNKISLEFTWMPNWTVKAKGKTYYVSDLMSEIGFSTRNREVGQTKGEIRFRNVRLVIDSNGVAKVS